MARARHNGNPGPPAGRYLMPARSRTRLRLALLAGGLVLAALLGLQLAGARGALQPGPLVSVHATSTGGRCHECHASMKEGASEIRCQRCHDPAGGGRYTHPGHVARIASVGRPGASTLAGPASCASCHVEHRGATGLARVDERQCASCHGLDPSRSGLPHRIADLPGHPEFHAVAAVAQRAGKPPDVEATGLTFSHDTHSLYVSRDLRRTTGEASLQRVCDTCHQLAPSGTGRRMDFAPISFEEHCVNCHQKQLPMPGAVPGPCDSSRESLVCGPDGARALVVEHKDAWVLARLAGVRRALDAPAHDAERATLLARASQLRRRLVLSAPYATLGTAQLQERRAVFAEELAALEKRLQPVPAAGAAGEGRLAEVTAALQAAGRAELAQALGADAAAVPPGSRPARAFEDRREELLALLAEVDAAADRELRNPALTAAGRSAAVRRKARAAEIRRRALAVVAGEDASAGLQRARDERRREIARVDDEMALRARGVPMAPMPDRERAALEAQLQRVLARLRLLDDVAAGSADALPRERLVASVDALLGAPGERCRMCHVVRGASIVPPRAAQRVLPLAPFVHEPHLGSRPPGGWPARGALPKGIAPEDVRLQTTTCTPCHARTGGGAEVQFSQKSGELHVMGIDGCRSCHFEGGIRSGCQVCHRYHPPPAT